MQVLLAQISLLEKAQGLSPGGPLDDRYEASGIIPGKRPSAIFRLVDF